MSLGFSAILSSSILWPAAVSIFRFSFLRHRYLPFILLLWTGVIAEAASFSIEFNNGSNAVVVNIFSLAEAMLFTWQFKRFGIFTKSRFLSRLYPVLPFFYVAWWVIENLIWNKVTNTNSWLIMMYSLFIVIMCLDQISDEMVYRSYRLLHNAELWLVVGIMIYSMASLMGELFYLYALNYTMAMQNKVFALFEWVNFLCNFIYFFALLWMPTRFRFTQPS